MLDDRARIRPRTKEELKKAMIENVEKARERVILSQHIVMGLFSRRKRQCPLGSQQA